jgi:hypothetical protein
MINNDTANILKERIIQNWKEGMVPGVDEINPETRRRLQLEIMAILDGCSLHDAHEILNGITSWLIKSTKVSLSDLALATDHAIFLSRQLKESHEKQPASKSHQA